MPSWSTPSTDYYADWYSSPAVEEAYEEIMRRRREIEARDRASQEAYRNMVPLAYSEARAFVNSLETYVVPSKRPPRKKSGFAKFVSRIEGK